MRSECYFCHIKTIQKLVAKFNPEPERASEFILAIHEYLKDNWEVSNPNLATNIHRIAKVKLNEYNLYAHEKHMANSLLMSNYSYWQQVVTESSDPFATAAKLAVVGNIIDYGAHSLNGDMMEQINTLIKNDLKCDQVDELREELTKAKSVLYLADNAGEIVFDRLFIETMCHTNVTLAVRGNPVINDVTLSDAQQVEMDKVCKVITNGSDAPSTLLPYCSNEFMEYYNEADLIISKGQGNFEGLMDQKHPNTFFMLIAKCDPMAELLGVTKNDMVIKKIKIPIYAF